MVERGLIKNDMNEYGKPKEEEVELDDDEKDEDVDIPIPSVICSEPKSQR